MFALTSFSDLTLRCSDLKHTTLVLFAADYLYCSLLGPECSIALFTLQVRIAGFVATALLPLLACCQWERRSVSLHIIVHPVMSHFFHYLVPEECHSNLCFMQLMPGRFFSSAPLSQMTVYFREPWRLLVHSQFTANSSYL